MTISKATKSRMAANFAFTFVMFSIVVYPNWRRVPESRSSFALLLILAPLLLALFPLMIERSKAVRLRKEQARAHWREDYQRSSEGNPINLHD